MKAWIAVLVTCLATHAGAATLNYGGMTYQAFSGSPTFRVTPGMASTVGYYIDVCGGNGACVLYDYYSGYLLGTSQTSGFSALSVTDAAVVNGLSLFTVDYGGGPIAGAVSASFTIGYQILTPFWYENGDFKYIVNQYDAGPFTVTASAVPVPAGAGLLALGLAGLWGVRRRWGASPQNA